MMAWANKEPSSKGFSIVQGADGLLPWAAGYMGRVKTPKSARDVVDAWYSAWRGKKDKPRAMTKKKKADYTERVADWMDRQRKRGTLVLADNAGRWKARRYNLADETRFNGVKQKLERTKASEKTVDEVVDLST